MGTPPIDRKKTKSKMERKKPKSKKGRKKTKSQETHWKEKNLSPFLIEDVSHLVNALVRSTDGGTNREKTVDSLPMSRNRPSKKGGTLVQKWTICWFLMNILFI